MHREFPVNRYLFPEGGAGRSVLVVLFLALALVSAGGCTPKSSSVPAVQQEETQAPAGDAFSLAVSRMQPGQQVVMPTPFGQDGLVMVDGLYTSGLGQQCRKATVQAAGSTHRVAVCRDESGWFTAEPVFEHVQR